MTPQEGTTRRAAVGVDHAAPLIRSAGVAITTRFLARLGAPVTRLLERAHISPSILENPEALVPVRPVAHFLADAAAREGIPDLGARIGLDTDLDTLGQFGRQVTRGLTVHDVVRTAAAIYPHYSPTERLWVSAGHGTARLHHAWGSSVMAQRGQLAGISVGLLVRLLQRANGPGWKPRRLVIQTTSDDTNWRTGVFGDIPVDLSPELSCIVMTEKDLSMPVNAPGPATIDPAWPANGPALDFEGTLRQVVISLLPSGYPDLNLVAEAAGTSARTAQRRLAEAGTSFSRIVDQARFDLARRLIADPRQKVIDVALELGYSDPAHFTRAFRRWTGTTPRAFRRDHLSGG